MIENLIMSMITVVLQNMRPTVLGRINRLGKLAPLDWFLHTDVKSVFNPCKVCHGLRELDTVWYCLF